MLVPLEKAWTHLSSYKEIVGQTGFLNLSIASDQEEKFFLCCILLVAEELDQYMYNLEWTPPPQKKNSFTILSLLFSTLSLYCFSTLCLSLFLSLAIVSLAIVSLLSLSIWCFSTLFLFVVSLTLSIVSLLSLSLSSSCLLVEAYRFYLGLKSECSDTVSYNNIQFHFFCIFYFYFVEDFCLLSLIPWWSYRSISNGVVSLILTEYHILQPCVKSKLHLVLSDLYIHN